MACHRELRVSANSSALFRAAATEFVNLASEAIRKRARFSVALAGGSTPKGLYSVLATNFRDSISWAKVFFFFGDERHVPPDDSESNYRMANEAMLSQLPIPAENVFRIRAEEDADKAAADYEKQLKQFFGEGDFPQFDLVLLGLGPDGHTASLFPGSSALQENSRLVVANWVEKFRTDRLTLTYPVLNAARCVMFLVSGSKKKSILQTVFRDEAAQLPAQRVCPVDGKLLWFVDQDAAGSLGG